MATVVTYVLVSDPDDPDAVKSHSLIDEHGFDLEAQDEGGEDARPSLRFAVSNPLEESPSLEELCRRLSETFSNDIVTFCKVEERFEQVEHLRTVVFIDGERAGEIEHGYVLNIGT